MTAIEDARDVHVRTDGDGREPWSISLVAPPYVTTIRMTRDEAMLVHEELGRELRLSAPPTVDERCPIITTCAGDPWHGCSLPAGHPGRHDFSVRLYDAYPEFGIAPPTDDEREALERVVEPILDAAMGDYGGGTYEDYAIADAILASDVWRNRRQGPITDVIRRAVGPVVKHAGGSGGVYEFTPNGTPTEFWSYGNAVAYTAAVNEILHLLDPSIDLDVRATTYAGGRAEPRTLNAALEAAERARLDEDAAPRELDPRPWLFISDQVFGEHRSDHDKSHHDVSGTYWVFNPRPQYEQDRAKYEAVESAR